VELVIAPLPYAYELHPLGNLGERSVAELAEVRVSEILILIKMNMSNVLELLLIVQATVIIILPQVSNRAIIATVDLYCVRFGTVE
jgi:hypothetical protein